MGWIMSKMKKSKEYRNKDMSGWVEGMSNARTRKLKKRESITDGCMKGICRENRKRIKKNEIGCFVCNEDIKRVESVLRLHSEWTEFLNGNGGRWYLGNKMSASGLTRFSLQCSKWARHVWGSYGDVEMEWSKNGCLVNGLDLYKI